MQPQPSREKQLKCWAANQNAASRTHKPSRRHQWQWHEGVFKSGSSRSYVWLSEFSLVLKLSTAEIEFFISPQIQKQAGKRDRWPKQRWPLWLLPLSWFHIAMIRTVKPSLISFYHSPTERRQLLQLLVPVCFLNFLAFWSCVVAEHVGHQRKFWSFSSLSLNYFYS